MQLSVDKILSKCRKSINDRVESYRTQQSPVYKEPYLTKQVDAYRSNLEYKHNIYAESLQSLVDIYNNPDPDKWHYDIYGQQSPFDSTTDIIAIREQALTDFINISGIRVSRETRKYSDWTEGTCTMFRCNIRR